MKDLVFNSARENVFFTSDTHFWHTNILKFCDRPFSSIEEMNEKIIGNWNTVVGPKDIIFHLGDFAFCGSKEYKELLERLNGKIHLILGNHDWKNIRQGYSSMFSGIYQQLRIRIDDQRIYLNHFPFLCFEGTWRDSNKPWQLFGHVHTPSTGLDSDRLQYLFKNQLDVGVDNHNFTPWEYNEIKQLMYDRENN